MAIPDSHRNLADHTASKSLDALIDLHSSCVDTLRGLQKMAEKAEPAFRPVVDQFCALHSRHAAYLDAMAREMGGVPDVDGSYMGTINRAVVSLRAVFDTIDAGVMDNVRSGEGRVLAAFDHALQIDPAKEHLQALTKMRAELSSMLDATSHLG